MDGKKTDTKINPTVSRVVDKKQKREYNRYIDS